MSDTLDNLLVRLKDGIATLAELERARALVRSDERVPDDLRDVVFVEASEIEVDATALLAVLGHDDLGAMLVDAVMDEIAAAPSFVGEEIADEGWDEIAAALREGLEEEASLGVDVAEAVMRRLPAADFARAALVAPAITAEAGEVDLSDAVLAGLGLTTIPVAEAVRAEAGPVDLAGAVAEEIGLQGFALAEAVWSEAGSVDVADAVASALSFERSSVADAVRAEAGKVDVVADVMSAIGVWRATAAPVESVAAPANQVRGGRFGLAGFALAAVALLSVVVGRLAVPVTGGSDLVFASAGEVQIDNLQVGTDVQVMQFEGDGGAVILWLETEV